MTAQRSAFDHEPDVLRGATLEETREESARLEAKANALTAYLARYHVGLTATVRENLERERDSLEWSASDLLARIAEHQGMIQKVRYPMQPPATGRLCAFGRIYRTLRARV